MGPGYLYLTLSLFIIVGSSTLPGDWLSSTRELPSGGHFLGWIPSWKGGYYSSGKTNIYWFLPALFYFLLLGIPRNIYVSC